MMTNPELWNLKLSLYLSSLLRKSSEQAIFPQLRYDSDNTSLSLTHAYSFNLSFWSFIFYQTSFFYVYFLCPPYLPPFYIFLVPLSSHAPLFFLSCTLPSFLFSVLFGFVRDGSAPMSTIVTFNNISLGRFLILEPVARVFIYTSDGGGQTSDALCSNQ